MGKAAVQRRKKRMRYLVRLAKEAPERFEKEWETRIFSWCEQIERDAGVLKGRGRSRVAGVFERVDEAMNILHGCGEEVFRRYGSEALDMLTAECCRHLARNVDLHLYRLNHHKRCFENVV